MTLLKSNEYRGDLVKGKSAKRKPAAGASVKVEATTLPLIESAASPDLLVGLSLNPGLRALVLPSAAEMRDLGSTWIRYLVV